MYETFSRWCSRHNHVCQVLKWNLLRLRLYSRSIFPFSYWFLNGLRTVQCYCAACDQSMSGVHWPLIAPNWYLSNDGCSTSSIHLPIIDSCMIFPTYGSDKIINRPMVEVVLEWARWFNLRDRNTTSADFSALREEPSLRHAHIGWLNSGAKSRRNQFVNPSRPAVLLKSVCIPIFTARRYASAV